MCTMSQQNDKSRPSTSLRAGKIELSIWRNEIDKDGRTIPQYSIRIKKRFRKDDGSYNDTDYYFPEELPKLAVLVQKAFEYVVLTERKDSDETVPM
jgi:hypothetical protein